MSEPKRYKVGKIGTTEMIDCVSYDDYARLKAQVERLTKAGDYMSSILQDNYNDILDDPLIIRDGIRRWHDAKEGKQP